MNGNYQNLGFNSGNPTYIPSQSTQPPFTNFPTQNTNQNSTLHIQNDQFQYAYNILNNNPNQIASFYMSYPDSVEWRDRIFTGRIIHSTREYTLLKKINKFKTLKPLTYQTKENTILNIENIIEISNMGINSVTMYFNPGLNIKKVYKSSISINTYEFNTEYDTDIIIKGIGFINIKNKAKLKIKIKDKNLIELRPSLFRK